MPRITRKQQKVFAADASNNGVFGSLQANDPTYSQDPDVIQGRTAYANGWNDATYSAEQLPPLEEFQSLQYLFSRQIAYLMQDGIPEWNSSTTYYKGALVKAIQGDGSFILYASLVDDNTNNLVTDTTKWVITNTSTNFHQGIPNWRADVIYSAGDWVKALNDGNWSIFESRQNNNLNNAITDTDYWQVKPFTSKLPLLWHSWFDHELDDVSWLRADTFSWQDGTVYYDVYNHLVDDIAGKSASTETVNGTTVTYYLADDGHKIVLAANVSAIETVYNSTGVAWYYVLDTTNTRFKLPRENPTKANLDTVNGSASVSIKGTGKTLGLTDGTNLTGLTQASSPSALFRATQYNGNVGASATLTYPTSEKLLGVTTDATKSGLTGTATITKTSYFQGKKYLYFYVGQFSQSATEQTAGLNSELFNGKLDLDLGNITPLSKEKITSWYMPSDNYVNLTLGASGTQYTAPANGWVVCNKRSSAAGQYINYGKQGGQPIQGSYTSYTSGVECWVSFPIRKGDKFNINYTLGGTTEYFRFIYAEGEI